MGLLSRGMMLALWGGLVTGLPAKIADPPAIPEGEYLYLSHANTVEKAVAVSRFEHIRAVATGRGKVVWRRELYQDIEPAKYDPNLEQDVQWNIITSLEMRGDTIVVTNKEGDVFVLDKTSGALIRQERVGDSRSTEVGRSRFSCSRGE